MRFDKKGLLVVFSGPSGVGKGTLRKKVFEKLGDKLYYSISKTSRAMREGEQNGVDYWFVTKDEFEKELNEDNFLEYNEYVGNYYGTPKDIIKKKMNEGTDVVLEIEVNGALQVMKKMPGCLSIFVAPPSMEELRNRLVGRNTDSPEVIEKRLKQAEYELALAEKYDYIVINDKVEDASEEIASIIESEHLKVNRALDDYYEFIGFEKE